MTNSLQGRDSVYQKLLASGDKDVPILECCLGLTWSYCLIGSNTSTGQLSTSLGFAQSPGVATRMLDFPGTIQGQPVGNIAQWLLEWDANRACLGMAALNSQINHSQNPLIREATKLPSSSHPNLDVFSYFLPKLQGKKVVVIGHYPGMETLASGLNLTVLERNPSGEDLPDPAAEYFMAGADWVFITATSLINKTFPRLAELAKNAVTVLMGPSLPWSPVFAEYNIDFLAGPLLQDPNKACQIAREGGGKKLFGEGVCYGLVDIGQPAMQELKSSIATVASQRAQLKQEMEEWYSTGKNSRFPKMKELERLGDHLSSLDTRYKRQWDARN